MDYYKILEVSQNASTEEIRRAYRRLALIWHPDKHTSSSNFSPSEVENQFKQIGEAYEILSDPEKRQIYDQYGKEGLIHGIGVSTADRDRSPFFGFHFHDPFEIFRQFFSQSSRNFFDPFEISTPFFASSSKSPFNDPFFSNDPFFMHDSFFNSSPSEFGFMHPISPFHHPSSSSFLTDRRHQQLNNERSSTNSSSSSSSSNSSRINRQRLHPFPSMVSSSHSSYHSPSSSSSSYSSRTMYSFSDTPGMTSQTTATRIVNGQKTTVITSTDAAGRVTEKTIHPDQSETIRVNGNLIQSASPSSSSSQKKRIGR